MRHGLPDEQVRLGTAARHVHSSMNTLDLGPQHTTSPTSWSPPRSKAEDLLSEDEFQ